MGKWLRVLLGALRWEHYLVRRLHNRATMSLHPCMSRRSLLATGPTANLFGMIIGACGYALKFKYATSPSSVAGRLREAGPAQGPVSEQHSDALWCVDSRLRCFICATRCRRQAAR